MFPKRKGSKIHYVYDFGDDWTHLVTQEGKVKAKKRETGPICLGGEGIAPPEDCGGIMGFEGLLDPESEHAENWDFDPKFPKHLREGKFSPEDVKFQGIPAASEQVPSNTCGGLRMSWHGGCNPPPRS